MLFKLLLLLTLCFSRASARCSTLQHDYPVEIVLADGWNTQLVANDLTGPRGMVLDTEGNLLVLDRGIGVVSYEIEAADNVAACLVEKKTVVADENLNHGIALSHNGTTLYVSSRNDVYAYQYDPSTRSIVSSSTIIVTNMDNSGHTSRTLYIHENYLLISAGSEANIDPGAADITTGRSAIKMFDLTEPITQPFDYPSDGRVLGWGLRNSVGVVVDSVGGGIWSVENSIDMLRREGQDVHQDNPGEELNFHGYVNETLAVQDFVGQNYGYPYCVAVWDVASLPDNSGLQTGNQIMVDQSTVGGESKPDDKDCNDQNQFIAPRLTFQAHMAPLDCKFDYFSGNPEAGGDGGLWVTFHGSWNRDLPTGYKLSKIPFDAQTRQPVAGLTERKNYYDIMWNRDTMRCRQKGCFRPVGVVVDSAGRVWMGSDATGEIFMLWTTGNRSGAPLQDGDENEEDDGDEASGENDAWLRKGNWGFTVVALGIAFMGTFL
ncbi:hypothetical protein BDZ91DRAFT_666010 [Kalaharituber pfeilii]|nr:hypothetical protein BDZ91DRAFT_666010 [Kalaharituber pfeilii]